MKKRVLSLLLALAMILGMLPVVALADAPQPEWGQYNETDAQSVDVTFTLSVNGAICIGNDDAGTRLNRVELTVPYFDLDLYGYGDLARYHSETGEIVQRPTALHAIIYLVERYYYGLDETECGTGSVDFSEYNTTYDEFGNEISGGEPLSITGSGTSMFINSMWNFSSYNMGTYINHHDGLNSYAEGTTGGWNNSVSACANYILLEDGDTIDMGMLDNFDFFTNGGNIFMKDPENTEDVTLTAGDSMTWEIDCFEMNWDNNFENVAAVWSIFDENGTELYNTPVASPSLTYKFEEAGEYTVVGYDPDAGSASAVFMPAVASVTVKESSGHTHSYEETVVPPTCTERGYTTFTCSCGASYQSNFVDKGDHSFEDGVCTGCGKTELVIPEGAKFTDMVADVDGSITVLLQEDYMGFPYFFVEIPNGTTYVKVTYPANTIQAGGSSAYVTAVPFEDHWGPTLSPAYTENDDGSITVNLNVKDYVKEDPYTGYGFGFWKPDGSEVTEIIGFKYSDEGTVIPDEANFLNMTSDAEGDIVIDYQETVDLGLAGQAPYFHVTLPKGATSITLSYYTGTLYNSTDGRNQTLLSNIDFTWPTIAGGNSTASTTYGDNGIATYRINVADRIVDKPYMNYGLATIDDLWNPVDIFTFSYSEEGEDSTPEYNSSYGITVFAGGEEMELVDGGTESCGAMQARKLDVTVPAGTTEVTFLNITDEVLWGQMYVYSGAHDWTEYASNVKEAVIDLEECGTSFCVSDSANGWYHVSITVEEPLPESSFPYTVTVDGKSIYAKENGTEWSNICYAEVTKYVATIPEGTTEFVVEGDAPFMLAALADPYNPLIDGGTSGTVNISANGGYFFGDYATGSGYHLYLEYEGSPVAPVPVYGFTASVGGEAVEMTAGETERCGMVTAQIYDMTVPAGTTSVTMTPTADSKTLTAYAGGCTYKELARGESIEVSVVEGLNKFCVSDWAGAHWYHVNITVEAPPHVHDYETVVTAPTCTEGGYTTYTCSCGDSYVDDETEALGHDYETVVTAPTCTEGGYTTYTCSCGDSYVDDETEALGHDYETAVTAPTHDRKGYTTTTCANCDYEEISDWTDALEHEYAQKVTKEATCTGKGIMTFTCDCGASYMQEIPAIGHEYEEDTTQAECETEGYVEKTCKHCGDSSIVKTIPATGHTEKTVRAKEATYEAEGYTGDVVCDVCAKVLEEGKVIPKLESEPEQDPCTVYTDVDNAAWYYEAVHYAVTNELMNGTSETTFAPTAETTRAMLATLLYRIAGEPSVAGLKNPFADVTADTWYTDAVIWAANNGVVNGTSETTFEPEANVTREQMVTMLHRYAGKPDADQAVLKNYSDAASIGSYAVDAMAWAISEGIINGTSETTLSPTGTASRAEIATILMRYLEK